MAAPGNVEWDTCAEDDCIGVRLPTGGKCWAHAHDQDLDAALKQFGEDGRLDARGVLITQDLLERLLTAAPHDDHGHLLLTDARFDRATFQDTAWFRDATFQGDAWFDRTTFRSDADFSAATLQGAAVFNRATFHHRAAFGGASFQRAAVFNRATFHHLAVFGGATFHHRAVFDGATFQDDTSFNRATFHHLAAFGGATFQRAASFGAATFQDDAVFPGVTFQRTATFDEATFQRARQLGPMLVRKSLKLDGATFHERVQIEVAAAAVCCQRARFLAGVQLRWAQVVLSDADLAAPSTLTGTPPFPSFDEEPLARILRRLRRPMHVWDGWPRLLSLRGADLAGLAVSNVDLRACRFGGAHNLDKLRIEGDDALGFAPPSWRWTKRQVIAEEHDWRSDQGEGAWDRPAYTSPAWLAVERLEPAQIASLYRALRKGHEDNKDEPGAADLYYGETEMRRHARRLKARQAWQEHHWGKWATVKPEHAVSGCTG